MHKPLLAFLLCALLALPAPVLAQSDSKAKQEETKKNTKKPREDVDKIGDRDVGKGVNFYSIEKEIALGKQFADEIERTARIVDDPVIAEYVNRVGQNLVRNSDAQVPFYFKVIDAEEINAFALPGGFCYVNTGLLMHAESEGEFAGVLAHEIAHVTARHGTRQATRGQIANLATIPLAILLGGGWGGYAIQQAAGLAIPLGFLQFSRAFESEADFLGLQYLYKAGYDPTAFVDFFEKLQALEKRKPGALAGVFRSHPMTEDRIENAQREIARILPSKPEYLVTTSEFLDVKERFARLVIDARDKKLAKDGPQLRRTAQTSGTIDPRGTQRPTAEAGAEEDGPPVLRRKSDTADSAGESTVESGAEAESEVILPPAPGSQQIPEPATQQAPPADDDPDRPILRRKNLR
jgi:beta-barrel assembly-enhancing protease